MHITAAFASAALLLGASFAAPTPAETPAPLEAYTTNIEDPFARFNSSSSPSLSKREYIHVDGLKCSTARAAWGEDCSTMVSHYLGDGTIQKPDKYGRIGIYYNSCLATVNYYTNSAGYAAAGGPIYTNDFLAELAWSTLPCWVEDGVGNAKSYHSGVGKTPKEYSNPDSKGFQFLFCIGNNNSGGSCK